MARITMAFTRKFNAKVNDVVESAYNELNGMAACAGINVEENGSVEAANKAIYNNEGRVRVYESEKGTVEAFIPGRPWVEYATGVGQGASEYTAALAKVIKDNLKAPRHEKAERKSIQRYVGGGRYTTEKKVVGGSSTAPFGGAKGKHTNAEWLMKRIAKQMAKNQREGIKSGGLAPNADSTKRRKKGDTPMVWTGEMLSNIEGFIE